jgi:protein arginine kinase
MRQILQVVNSFGVNLYGLNMINSKNIGDMYELENKQTLGITEEEIIKNLKIITEKIVEQERTARKMLGKNYRSFGILTNCRKIKKHEALELLSDVKLGVDLGIIKEIDDKKICELYFYINESNLQKYYGENLDTYSRDIKRAEMIKKISKKE